MSERNEFTKEPACGSKFPFNIYRYNVYIVDGPDTGDHYSGAVNAASKNDARKIVAEL